MSKYIFLFIGALFLSGCTEKESPALNEKPIHAEETRIEDYFPQENKTYIYRGEGNEFATFKEVFYKKTDSYLTSIVENGGTRLLRIYQLKNNGIYTVYEQPEFYEENVPSFEELKQEFKPTPLLIKPIKSNKTFNNWKIIDTTASLDHPLGQLKNVIILEQVNQEDNTIVRNYWAPGIGKVKQEFISKEHDGEEYRVTSELVEIK